MDHEKLKLQNFNIMFVPTTHPHTQTNFYIFTFFFPYLIRLTIILVNSEMGLKWAAPLIRLDSTHRLISVMGTFIHKIADGSLNGSPLAAFSLAPEISHKFQSQLHNISLQSCPSQNES